LNYIAEFNPGMRPYHESICLS